LTKHRASVKDILRVLFVYDEGTRINLFDSFPWLASFFRKRIYFALLRSFSDVVFTILIFWGLFGPQDRYNPVLFISWGIWWTSIVLSWFFVGRMWCAFCPFPGIGRILQHFSLSLKKRPPRLLDRYCTYIATLFFAFIIWAEAVFHLKYSPLGTSLLLLSILTGATFFALIYKGQAWCRYFCPMGKIIGSAATMSLLEFRPDLEKCRGCKTFACKRGKDALHGCPVYLGAFNVRNNLLCLDCGHCLILCENNSPAFYLRHPLRELIINKGRHLTCTYIIPFLMASQLSRFVQEKCSCYQTWKAYFGHSEALTFSLVLGAWFVFFMLLIRLGTRLFNFWEDELFGRFSPMVPVMVPLAFTGELIYRLEYFLRHLGEFLNYFGLGRVNISPLGLKILSLLLLLCGFAGSIYVAYIFYAKEFKGAVSFKNFLAILVLIIMVEALYLYYS